MCLYTAITVHCTNTTNVPLSFYRQEASALTLTQQGPFSSPNFPFTPLYLASKGHESALFCQAHVRGMQLGQTEREDVRRMLKKSKT